MRISGNVLETQNATYLDGDSRLGVHDVTGCYELKDMPELVSYL